MKFGEKFTCGNKKITKKFWVNFMYYFKKCRVERVFCKNLTKFHKTF